MPSFVIGALIAGGITAGVGVAAGSFAFGSPAFMASFWTAFGTSAILGGLGTALAKKPSQPDLGASDSIYASQGRNVTIQQPISPWQQVVGETRCGGTITFMELSADKRYFHMIVTLASHRCAALTDVIIDDEIIAPDMRDADGNVTSGRYAKNVYTPRVHTGTGASITTTYAVDSVQSVTYYGLIGESGGFEQYGQIALTEVSGTPTPYRLEYSRSGDTFTFPAGINTLSITINYTQKTTSPLLRVQVSLGDEAYGTQPFPALVTESAGKWTSAHRQDGHTKMYLRFASEVLTGGRPKISAVVRGRLDYDPRTGLDAWTANPALAVSEYLCDEEIGFGADYAEEIDQTLHEAAANECEERVLLAGNTTTFTADATLDVITVAEGSRTPSTGMGVRVSSSGSLPTGLSAATTYYAIRYSARRVKLATSYANACAGTAINLTSAGSGTHTLTYYDEPRYTANGTFVTSERRSDVLERLQGVMGGGRLPHVSDVWHIFAGGYEAPTVTLDEGELVGGIEIEPMPDGQDTANGARGVFVDPDSAWQPTDFPAVTSSTYLAEDAGERVWADLDLSGFVTSVTLAQRLAKIELRRQRFGLSWTATFQLRAFRTVTGRSFAMDFSKYGWSGEAFEVQQSDFVLIDTETGPAPGVRLSARETSADIWDWSASEDASTDPVPPPNLPDPSAIDPPGVPSVTEEIYETTGSAGVKTRALMTWSAPDDALAASYEVRYKRAEATDYTYLPRKVDTGAQIDDLAAGVFLFGVRAVNVFGRESEWVGVVKELVGLTAPPADLTNFSLTPLNDKAQLSWDKATDLDVRIGGRILLRWSDKTTGATWNDGIDLLPGGAPGDKTDTDVPLLAGTYMARAQDSSGNQSTNFSSVVTTAAGLVNFNAVATATESPGFAGTKTLTAVSGGVLSIATGIDGMSTLIDDWGLIDLVDGVASQGTYEFSSAIDLGAVYSSRVSATLTAQAVDVNDLIDSRLDPIDSWGLIDGAEISDVSAQLQVATTEDDPAGSPTWTSWRPFFVGDYKARGLKFRLVLSSLNANHNIEVSALGVTVDMPDREDGARNVASGTGTYSVSYTLSPAFKALPKIAITAKDMGTGDYFTITSETTGGFDVAFKNSGGSGVSRNFDWRAKGY